MILIDEFGTSGRYRHEAYEFLLLALDYTTTKLARPDHVSGQELLLGIREYAQQQFGLLARPVFESWGVRRTDDFGELVFELVEAGILGKTAGDSKADFSRLYDFHAAFDHGFRLVLDAQGTDVSQHALQRRRAWRRLFQTEGPN